MHKKGSHPLPLRTPRTQFVHVQLGSSRWQQIGKRRRSPYLPTRTDKSRKEPTRAVKRRQEAFLY